MYCNLTNTGLHIWVRYTEQINHKETVMPKKIYSFNLDTEVRAMLDALAKTEGRSSSNYLEHLIRNDHAKKSSKVQQ